MGGKTLYVLDLDRTLLDVDEAMGIAEETCKNLDIDFSKIKADQQKSFKQAKPYSPLATIEGLGGGLLGQFKNEFLKLAEPKQLVFPDAKRYLEWLNKSGNQYLILTYARDERWQELKMQAAKLDLIPHIIIFHSKKGHDIAEWVDKEGLFRAPVDGISPARRIVFIDDRLRVFDGMPRNCKGYYLKRSDWQEDTDANLANITQISSFDEIIDKL